jgi:hypothetical protein
MIVEMNTPDIDKQNIHRANLDLCYDTMKNIPLSRFTFNEEIIPVQNRVDRTVLGWIHEDIQPVLPKAVQTLLFNVTKKRIETAGLQYNDAESDECTTIRRVHTDQIYATMFGAVQKLIQDKESLEATILSQQEQINTLQQQLTVVLTKLS